MKNAKRKYLLLTIVAFLALNVYTFLIPMANGIGQGVQLQPTTQQKGAVIINKVAGFDLTKYNFTSSALQSFYLCLPSLEIKYELSSQKGKLNIATKFTNGDLRMLEVYDKIGPPILAKPEAGTAVGEAQNFLANYQTLTAKPLFGQLKATLDNVEGMKNLTQISGNAKLEITTLSDGYTAFKWTYVANGIIAPSKFVALGFKDNSFSYFVDDWQLYNIGSSSFSVSKDQA
jgi:hypothetical protein